MAKSSFRLDRKGGAEVLNQMAAPHVNALVREVAGGAGEDAVFNDYSTDRAAGSVSVPAEKQAIDGVLTRAAAAAGLEVRSK